MATGVHRNESSVLQEAWVNVAHVARVFRGHGVNHIGLKP